MSLKHFLADDKNLGTIMAIPPSTLSPTPSSILGNRQSSRKQTNYLACEVDLLTFLKETLMVVKLGANHTLKMITKTRYY